MIQLCDNILSFKAWLVNFAKITGYQTGFTQSVLLVYWYWATDS